MDEELVCDVTGICVAPETAHGTANCIYCGKELVERDGEWYTWDADLLTPHPKPQATGRKADPAPEIREVRYLTDDRDHERHRCELVISRGGNGDLYIAVVPEGEGCIGRSVRICTSGGASVRVPGLGLGIANAFRALIAAGEGGGVTLKS